MQRLGPTGHHGESRDVTGTFDLILRLAQDQGRNPWSRHALARVPGGMDGLDFVGRERAVENGRLVNNAEESIAQSVAARPDRSRSCKRESGVIRYRHRISRTIDIEHNRAPGLCDRHMMPVRVCHASSRPHLHVAAPDFGKVQPAIGFNRPAHRKRFHPADQARYPASLRLNSFA